MAKTELNAPGRTFLVQDEVFPNPFFLQVCKIQETVQFIMNP
jgi:hypothetical protein